MSGLVRSTLRTQLSSERFDPAAALPAGLATCDEAHAADADADGLLAESMPAPPREALKLAEQH